MNPGPDGTSDQAARPARVLILVSFAPSLVPFRGHLIADLARAGSEVLCAAPGIDAETAEALARLGGRPLSLAMARTGMNPFADLGSALELFRLFRRERPEVVIAYTAKPIVWGGFAAALARVPGRVAVVTGLGYAFTGGEERRRRIAKLALAGLYRLALRLHHRVLFLNPDDRALFSAMGLLPAEERVAVIDGEGVDTDFYAPAPLPQKPVFLMIARFLGDKGVRDYVAAAERLKARYPYASFRLVGWRDDSPDAVSAAEEASWPARGIELIGRLADIRPAMAEAGVYVLPSYREGTSRSVLEAMAMGRPIVSTDAPGCREPVEEGVNGFLVPVRDPDALAAAMERFILEPGLAARMGAQSRQMAVDRYDVRRVNRIIRRHAGLAP